MQVLLHAGQRRDDDDRVENDHEVRGRGQAEYPAKMLPSQRSGHNLLLTVRRFRAVSDVDTGLGPELAASAPPSFRPGWCRYW
jgi:hypothetical protein